VCLNTKKGRQQLLSPSCKRVLIRGTITAELAKERNKLIVEIVEHTPLWVFVLFVFLIILGLQQSKQRTVKKFLLLPLPIGMAFLSYYGVFSSFGLSPVSSGLWLFALVSVAYFSGKYFPAKGVEFSAEAGYINIPGSWVPLLLMMAIFFSKYLVAVLSALQPSMLLSAGFMIFCTLLYGAFSGVFVARAMSMWGKKENQIISKT